MRELGIMTGDGALTNGVQELKARRLRDELWIEGVALVSDTCHQAYVEHSSQRIYPPRFQVLQRKHQGDMQICATVVAPRSFRGGPFHFPQDKKTVVVYTGVGQSREVEIEELRVPGHVETSIAFDGNVARAAVPTGFEYVTATGQSSKLSIDEAVLDAVHNLPASPPEHPDELRHFKVLSMGLEVGGLPGLNRFVVTVGTLQRTKGQQP